MKKNTLFAVVLAALAMTACKKDHTCTCTIADSSGSTVHTLVVKNSTKKALKSGRCYNGTLSASFSGFSFSQNQTCTIK